MHSVQYHLKKVKESPSTANWPWIFKLIDEAIATGLSPADPGLRDLFLPVADLAPDDVELPANVALVYREIDRHLSARPSEERPIPETPSQEVVKAAILLGGKEVALVGGLPRPLHQKSIIEAFDLKDLRLACGPGTDARFPLRIGHRPAGSGPRSPCLPLEQRGRSGVAGGLREVQETTRPPASRVQPESDRLGTAPPSRRPAPRRVIHFSFRQNWLCCRNEHSPRPHRFVGRIPPSRIKLNPFPGTAKLRDLEKPENKLCELIAGTLVEKPMGWEESMLAIWIAGKITSILEESNLGHVTGPDGMYQFFPGRARGPMSPSFPGIDSRMANVRPTQSPMWSRRPTSLAADLAGVSSDPDDRAGRPARRWPGSPRGSAPCWCCATSTT